MGDKEKEKGTSGDSKTEKGKQKNGTLDKEETSRYKVLHDGSNNLSKEERAEQEQMEDERIMERLTEALEEGLKGTPGGFILLEQKLLFVWFVLKDKTKNTSTAAFRTETIVFSFQK